MYLRIRMPRFFFFFKFIQITPNRSINRSQLLVSFKSNKRFSRLAFSFFCFSSSKRSFFSCSFTRRICSHDFRRIDTLGARSLSFSSGTESLSRWNFSFKSFRRFLSRTLWEARVKSESFSDSSLSPPDELLLFLDSLLCCLNCNPSSSV